jgi:GNAT superfamily N-acetyltransferase
METYLEGKTHPREALAPRVAYVASLDGRVIGYIAGHLTTRLGCDGEVQFLFVALEHRRQGVASHLLRVLAKWFAERGAKKICVDVNADSEGASPFYLSQGAVPLSKHWYIWDDIRVLNRASA